MAEDGTRVNAVALDASAPPPWFVRALRKAQPREGWIVFILAAAGVICLPMAAIEGRLLPGLGAAVWLALLGLTFAWWLGHRRWSGWLVAPVTLLGGCIADLIWGVYVFNPLPLIPEGARWLIWWVGRILMPELARPAPAAVFFEEQVNRLTAFAQRVGWWVNGVVSGEGLADNLVLVGFAALLAWLVAAWAGWWLARRGRAFVALLPTGMLLVQQTYNADAGYAWLLVYAGSLTMLLVLGGNHWLIEEWERTGVDYSPEIRLEAGLIGLLLVALVLIASPTLPFLTSREASEAFWRMFGEPYREVEQRLTQSFVGVQPGRSLIPPSGVAAGGLPRAHLLGGRPELGQEIALRVRVRGARSSDLLYWRGQTFAGYTGRGWEAGAPAAGRGSGGQPAWSDLVRQALKAGESWIELSPAGRHQVLSSVEVVEASRSVLYAAGEPLSADRPYEATVRAPGELVALSGQGGPVRYTVLGAVLDADPNLLRAAGERYPGHIAELYLGLPENLPAELRTYAAEITSAAATPYDKALAIEAALRRLSYSLDVPAPPAGREVVSWFLFDLRQGYCDYFASAMVVLARLNRVPARLAIGYATGEYDPRSDRYEVSELQAHSWPEIYFPGFGWAPFEPTPARATPARGGEAGAGFYPYEDPIGWEQGLNEIREQGSVYAAAATRTLRTQRGLGAINLLLVLSYLFVWFRLRNGEPPTGAASWYARLARWGGRLGQPLRATDTSREYVAALDGAVERALERVLVRRASAEWAAEVVRADAAFVAEAYETSLYAPEAIAAHADASPDARWTPLWAAFRRLWWARWRV